MVFHVITIFPEMFDSYLKESILGRAIENKLITIKFYNPRDFIKAPKNNYRPVDDKPYGGGPGMVMRAEPLLSAVAKALADKKAKKGKTLIINFIPSAEKFTTKSVKNISKKYSDIILICGRYEGIDARVDKILSAQGGSASGGKNFKFKKFSIGDYVVTGGELPAMVLIDSISRQIPGVLGKYESLEEERISSSEVYTRPEILKWKNKNYRVPKILLSGNHKKIKEWKQGK
jgi:tRNA (guanine37-N1)-methyltransferase